MIDADKAELRRLRNFVETGDCAFYHGNSRDAIIELIDFRLKGDSEKDELEENLAMANYELEQAENRITELELLT